MTEEPRTPLTLEYAPDAPEEEQSQGVLPVIVVEPSFRYPGTIFMGIHPFGKRLGCHLLPADAERVRNHLSKLLMDPGAPVEAGDPEQQGGVDWSKRIEQAAVRQIAAKRQAEKPKKRRRRRPLQFRLEFSLGKVQGVVGTPVE